MNRMPRLWGGMLIAGGLVVGGVIAWLFGYYVQEGIFSPSVGVMATVAGIVMLVLPQVGFGLYILRLDRQMNNDEPPDNTV